MKQEDRKLIRENKDLVVKDIPLKLIQDNPYQTRKRYGKLGITKLAKNISERGLFHPIAVVQVKDKYVIVAGHRRKRAYKKLNRKTIPAIIRKKSSQKDLALDLAIENALRKDFTPIEKANAIFQVLCTVDNVNNDLFKAYSLIGQIKLMNDRGIERVKFSKGDSIGLTDDDLFRGMRLLNMLDISENTASRYLRLLTLPKSIQNKVLVTAVNEKSSLEGLEKGVISLGYGYELSRIKDNKLRVILYERTIKEKWRYIQLRHIVNELIANDEKLQVNKLGTSKKRVKEDYGLGNLTKRCFNLSSSLWNFRRYLPIIPMSLDKVVLRAALQKLKKSCLILIHQINDLLLEEISLDEQIDLVNSEVLELPLKKYKEKFSLRTGISMQKIKVMDLKEGDKLRVKVEGIVRKNN